MLHLLANALISRLAMRVLWNILAVIFFCSGIGAEIFVRAFWSMLRTQHVATWESLGKPRSILNPKFILFLLRGEYEALADKKIAGFARSLRRYYICVLILIVALAVVSLLLIGVPP
jgi:hypothetical protein